MQIEVGPQINCSELVIRLGTNDEDEAREMLAEVGLIEYMMKDRYGCKKTESNWDSDLNCASIVELRSLPKNVRNALKIANFDDGSKKCKAAQELLTKHGIDYRSASTSYLEVGKSPEEYDPGIWIGNYPYDNDNSELAVWYSQHCQVQGFPTLKKIAEHIGAEVEAHDGGSTMQYDAWIDGDEEDEE